MKPPKVSPIFREVELSFERHLSARARSQRLASYALDKITEAKRINGGGSGQLAPHRQIVDGREGAALVSVKPDGVIVARFNLLNEALKWIGGELVRNGPVLTGRFNRSHVLYVDGEPHDPKAPIPDGRVYMFVNVQPYARRIEKGWSKKVPDGLYEGIAAVAGQRFGNLAKVTFGWQALHGAAPLEGWADKTSLQRNDRDLKGAALDEWRRRQPTIFVRPH